ncbi:hypothetical protein [Photobacterium damselae]|uniref:hypothetical protein n=1 Tax=Photobacterium damselae TaxID=38293 RepID=UPI0010FD5A05|nr:hypothetical protein [Photobacterium damselae]KAB1512001.1 hypothetical protein FD717_010480 [Photobacterium damselae subsp. damselae]TLS80273.1 hypothetical protein FD721_01730 [Photobacterium damselae subsp. damselae]
MKSFNQLLFFKNEQITLLEQWKNCDEYGLTTKQFCEALIENGTSATKEIGQAGRDAPAHGKHFTDVLMDWMPPMIVCAIATAEKAGDRQAGLDAAINQLQGGQNIIFNIVKALWFPFVLMIVTGALGLYVSDEILKSLTEKEGMGQTMNTIVSTYGLPIAIMLIALLIATALALPTLTGALRKNLDNLPIFSIYKTATAASVLNTLGNLLACGLKLDDALQAMGTNSVPYVRAHIELMRQQRIGQMNLGEIVDTGLILPFELGTLKILGGHAEYATLLLKSAHNHQTNVDKRLSRMSNSLNKIGLLLVISLLGGLIGTAISQLLSTVNF